MFQISLKLEIQTFVKCFCLMVFDIFEKVPTNIIYNFDGCVLSVLVFIWRIKNVISTLIK